jgi:hypothetical protein
MISPIRAADHQRVPPALGGGGHGRGLGEELALLDLFGQRGASGGRRSGRFSRPPRRASLEFTIELKF